MKTLTPIALIIAAVGLFYMYINPQYQVVKQLNAKSAAYDQAIVEAQTVVSKRNELVARKDNFKPEDIARLQKLLPDNIDNIRLIIDINHIAVLHNTTLKDIRVVGDSNQKTPSTDTKLYGAVTVNFSVDLTYDHFLSFMNDLEKSLQLFDVTSLVIKPTDDGTPYNFSVALKTYWLKQ